MTDSVAVFTRPDSIVATEQLSALIAVDEPSVLRTSCGVGVEVVSCPANRLIVFNPPKIKVLG